jgi:hypothetical protein
MSGDRARGDWTPWPVVPSQLELDPLADVDPEPASDPEED